MATQRIGTLRHGRKHQQAQRRQEMRPPHRADQWSPEERRRLMELGHSPSTFNLIKPPPWGITWKKYCELECLDPDTPSPDPNIICAIHGTWKLAILANQSRIQIRDICGMPTVGKESL